MSKLAFYYINKPASISIKTFFWTSTMLLFYFIGAYGSIIYTMKTNVFLEQRSTDRFFVRQKPQKKYTKKFLGLFFSLISAALQDLSLSYKCFLEMHGIGFRLYRLERKLLLEVGFSHKIYISIPSNIIVRILNKKNTKFLIHGFHRHEVREFANLIQLAKIPNEYTLKGIHYKNQWLRKKPGKQAQQK